MKHPHHLTYANRVYFESIDCLVRVYPNQSPNHTDQDAFCGEVLFKPHVGIEHAQFTAPYPRGLAEACSQVLLDITTPLDVQVSNELPYTVGCLTSCDQHFDIRFKDAMEDVS